jgi:prepilin peptidase CpaA
MSYMHGCYMAGRVVLALVLAISVYTDVRYGKILNKVVLPCVPAGLLIWGVGAGFDGLLFSLEGMAVAVIALLVAATLRWIAPGDAKLILAVGVLAGPAFVASTMLLGALAGGAIAIAMLVRRHLLMPMAKSAAVAYGSRIQFSTVWSTRAGYMPYSVPIALGAVAAQMLRLW